MMMTSKAGTVTAASRGWFSTNTPARIPTIPLRSGQSHDVERSTKTRTSASIPVMSR